MPVHIVLVLVLVLVPVHIVLVLVLVLVQVLVHIAAPGSGVASQGCSALLHRTPLLSASASTFLLSRATVASRIRTGAVLLVNQTSKASHLPTAASSDPFSHIPVLSIS